MIKKVYITIGVALAIINLEEILYNLFGRNAMAAVIANWGTYIIPSFIVGLIMNIFVEEQGRKSFSKFVAAFSVVFKLAFFLKNVSRPTILAVVLIIIIYYNVSYRSILFSRKIFEMRKIRIESKKIDVGNRKTEG